MTVPIAQAAPIVVSERPPADLEFELMGQMIRLGADAVNPSAERTRAALGRFNREGCWVRVQPRGVVEKTRKRGPLRVCGGDEELDVLPNFCLGGQSGPAARFLAEVTLFF
jgi:hypothetical protein